MLTDLETLEHRLHEMANDQREITITDNTRADLEAGVECGLVKPVSGKFRMLHDGILSSVYRLV